MYERIFSSDNPFWLGMGRLFDTVELNLLWLLCSLPLFTAGPAAAALYAAFFALGEGLETYPHRDFFRAFRTHLRRNTGAGLLFMLVTAFLWTDVWTARHAGTGIFTFLMVFFAVLLLFWLFLLLYALPLLALCDGTLKEILILSFTLSLRHFPRTLGLFFITAVCFWLCRLAPLLILGAVGISVQMKTALLRPVLTPWFPNPVPPGDETEGSRER